MTYIEIFNIMTDVFFAVFSISVLLILDRIIFHIYGFFRTKELPEADKKHKFAILIPARNESRVIAGLLESIKLQNYDKDLLETYVIVESENDPTCQIAKNYENTHVFVRRRLDLKGKGHALNEVITEILEQNRVFDAFMIVDADNVLYSNFIEEMNKTYCSGYKIAVGYRSSKNWNDGWVSTCSALTFASINTFSNKFKARHNLNVTVSGSGFYIDYDIIKNLGGWPFHTLTEDYELSLFATANNIRTFYNERAKFYDEQPKSFKMSVRQRLRWIKGFGQSNAIYRKKLLVGAIKDKELKASKLLMGIGVFNLIVLIATVIIYFLLTLGYGIYGLSMGFAQAGTVLMASIYTLFYIYLFFMFYAALGIIAEGQDCKLTPKNIIIALLLNPIFVASYLFIYIHAFFKKEVEWKPIEHSVNINPQTGERIN